MEKGATLIRRLPAEFISAEIEKSFTQSHSYLFADAEITITNKVKQQMAELIAAIEYVVALPQYQQQVIAHAPMTAKFTFGTRGGILSYDFHLTANGPKLIEINTNAGGALLNGLLLKTSKISIDKLSANPDTIDGQLVEVFKTEWQLQRSNKVLKTIAIVDENPQQQFLYPEFLLFQELFQRHNITAIIANPQELVIRNQQLYYHDLVIDLVYNRLTDFYLQNPANNILRQAYIDNIAVVTPNVHDYKIYADKRNLTILTCKKLLQTWKVPQTIIETLLTYIPETFVVDNQHQAVLWEQRKDYFFKPFLGYGSKGSYRGDKLTKRVFQEIINSDYIAQLFIPASEQTISCQDQTLQLKVDVRDYVYNNKILFAAARLYQGQTTNFRTPGGGFAPVVIID